MCVRVWMRTRSRVCACECVCVLVCVCLYIDYLKKFLTDLMKLGRMIYNDKKQVPFEDELNRVIRTEVTEPVFILFLIASLSLYFSDVTSPCSSLER